MTIATAVMALSAAAATASPESILITAERPPSRVLPPVVELNDEQLLERQPKSAADAVKALPGVTVRTNSRGETIARIRGSEERQTQVFLDGAPLAVPWDGRADIGIIPAGLIGTVRATKGAVPIEYGTNAVAGAIDLETRSGGPAAIRAMGGAGSLGFAEGAAVASLPVGAVDFTLAAAGLTRDAEPVASLKALPFSQPIADAGRTPTSTPSAFSELRRTSAGRWRCALRCSVSTPSGGSRQNLTATRRSTRRVTGAIPDITLTQLNLGSELRAVEPKLDPVRRVATMVRADDRAIYRRHLFDRARA